MQTTMYHCNWEPGDARVPASDVSQDSDADVHLLFAEDTHDIRIVMNEDQFLLFAAKVEMVADRVRRGVWLCNDCGKETPISRELCESCQAKNEQPEDMESRCARRE